MATAQTLIALPESEVKRIYRKAGERPPHVVSTIEAPDEWVPLSVLKERTNKTTDQIRYIRQQYPELTEVKEGKGLTRGCYLYNITQIIKKSL